MNLIALEVVRRCFVTVFQMLAAVRLGAFIAVSNIVVVIYMALEVFGTMEPWTGTDEDSA
jgi:hypothetical protein